MLRTIPVRAEDLGLVSAGTPEPLMRWDDQNGRRVQSEHQEIDQATGQRLWTVYALPTLSERPEVISIRTSADHQPVLAMFAPISVDGLAVNVRVGKDGKVAQYWSATGARDTGQGHKRQEHKQHEQAA